MKLNYYTLLLITLFAVSIYTTIYLTEGIHNFWKDITYSIVDSVVMGLIVAVLIEKVS